MRIPDTDNSIFCIVDMQEKFLPAISEMPAALGRTEILLRAMNELKVPLLVTEQYPRGLGPTLPSLKMLLPEGTPVIEKTSFSCFADKIFREELEKSSRKVLLLAGVETHVCLLQTALEAAAAGYEVYLAEDAVASRRPSDKESALRMMRHAGINVIPSESWIFLLLKDAAHPAFKAISKLIR